MRLFVRIFWTTQVKRAFWDVYGMFSRFRSAVEVRGSLAREFESHQDQSYSNLSSLAISSALGPMVLVSLKRPQCRIQLRICVFSVLGSVLSSFEVDFDSEVSDRQRGFRKIVRRTWGADRLPLSLMVSSECLRRTAMHCSLEWLHS